MGNKMSRLVVTCGMTCKSLMNNKLTQYTSACVLFNVCNQVCDFFFLFREVQQMVKLTFLWGLCIKTCMKNPVDCCRGPAAFLMAF